ncbi:cyclodeaminase/cyclohydrolase family protein [Candidatus Bipolaricaulota bacterium]|nr:cyclodeaminase/cyclohydrolase family protein [Candidatus Bipolaricaulota bacterium]
MNDSNANQAKARDQVMEDFLSDLASDKPAPGGGSAAAVAGALSAALSAMVANLTVGKSGYEDVSDDYESLLSEANDLREKFLEAIAEDMEAYNRVMDAYRAPRDTQEDKESRRVQLQKALKGATKPPLKMAELAKEVLDLSRECAKTGNSHAVTDAGASAILAEAATRTALLNVDINLGSITDDEFVSKTEKRRKELEEGAISSASEVVELMNEKL